MLRLQAPPLSKLPQPNVEIVAASALPMGYPTKSSCDVEIAVAAALPIESPKSMRDVGVS